MMFAINIVNVLVHGDMDITDHDTLNARLREAVASTDSKQMAIAFLASLGNRNLLGRAAFGSFVILQHLPKHAYAKSEVFSGAECRVCGLVDRPIQQYAMGDPPKLSWMHHTSLPFCHATLSSYLKQKVSLPTERDRELLQELLQAIRDLPAEAQLTQMLKAVPKSIKSNKNERTCLLQILGFAGILCPPEQKDYCHEFLPYDFVESAQPPHFYKRDWSYPVRWWEGRHGVNEDRVQEWFGEFLEFPT